GHRLLLAREHQRQGDFQAFLELLAEHYRGWRPWLLLDGDSSHTANASVALAQRLHVGLLWLPKRCPELNGMDHLWGHANDQVCANNQDPSIAPLAAAFIRHIQSLHPLDAKRKAGFLSDHFWLRLQCPILSADLLRVPPPSRRCEAPRRRWLAFLRWCSL